MLKNIDYKLVLFIIIASFFQGIASIVGIPSILYDLSIDAVIIFLFLRTFKRIKLNRVPGLIYFALFITVFLISVIINTSDLYISIAFIRNTFYPYLFFIAIIFLNINIKKIFSINGVLYALVLLQIGAAIIKYLLYGGPRESGFIGTFSLSAGQMSTLFPLFVIIIASLYILIYQKKVSYYVLIVGMLFFAYGGGKRAFIILLPLFFIILYLMYRKYEKDIAYLSPSNIFRFILPSVLIIPAFIIYAVNTPSLNPEGIRGGSFSINHIIEYTDRYHTDDHFHDAGRVGGPRGVQLAAGRVHTRKRAYEIISEQPLTSLIGLGPSAIHGASRGDERLISFRVVSFMTGISQYLMSVGILGSILLILIYFSVCYPMLKYYQQYPRYWRPLVLAMPVLFLLFLFDFTNYSAQFAHGYIPSIVYFYIAGILINYKKQFIGVGKHE